MNIAYMSGTKEVYFYNIFNYRVEKNIKEKRYN